MARNPYVFLVGCPRSGTTLLRRLVGAHSRLAITPETHWITRMLADGVGVTPGGFVTRDLIPVVLGDRRFLKLGVGREELEQLLARNGKLSYADFVAAVFDRYGSRRNKLLVGDKTPGYVREITVLHRLWPEARFVHLIRDGRDVCLSALSWEHKAARFRERFPTWDRDPVTTAAVWWRWLVTAGLDQGGRLPPGLYYELRFEALVTDPHSECRLLCDFLGLPFDDAMLHFHEGRTRDDPRLASKRRWLPPTAGLRDWRTQMPAEDVERFEAAAGDVLDRLGYVRAVPRPGASQLERAAEIAAVFPRRPQPEGVER